MVSEQDLTLAVELLRNGGVVGIPTETVYGLAANALNEEAVRRIYTIKGRPSTSPLIVHVSSFEMARELASFCPASAELLARRFWPGPLTMVLPKASHVPDIVTAGLSSIGLRMPAHPVTLELIGRCGLPLAAPSANRFTRVSPTTAAHVRESLGDDVPHILDGGPCDVGIESTVLSLTGETPILLRPGMISQAELEEALGVRINVACTVEGAHPSPGMHARHYSPQTPVYLWKEGELPAGRNAYLWWHNRQPAELLVEMPPDSAAYAKRLYLALHEADQAGLDRIVVETPPETSEWAAVHDRLWRAAQPLT